MYLLIQREFPFSPPPKKIARWIKVFAKLLEKISRYLAVKFILAALHKIVKSHLHSCQRSNPRMLYYSREISGLQTRTWNATRHTSRIFRKDLFSAFSPKKIPQFSVVISQRHRKLSFPHRGISLAKRNLWPFHRDTDSFFLFFFVFLFKLTVNVAREETTSINNHGRANLYLSLCIIKLKFVTLKDLWNLSTQNRE